MLRTNDRDPGEIAALIARLKERNPNTQRLTRLALLQFGASTFAPLTLALKDEDWELRRQAAMTLGELGDPRAIEPLCGALEDLDWEVRSEAAEALLRLADERALLPLARGAADEHWRVRQRCVETLALLIERAPRAAAESAQRREIIAALLKAVEDSDRGVRRHAASALGNLGSGAAVPALVEALRDRDMEVRATAAAALSNVGDSRAVLGLIAALQDQERIRFHAAEALGCIAERDPTPGLEGALPRLRRLVGSAGHLGEFTGAGDVYQAAIRSIERSTARVRGLPLPAGPASAATGQLPLVGKAPLEAGTLLPRPAEAPSPTLAPFASSHGHRFPLGAVRRWLTHLLRVLGRLFKARCGKE